MSWQPRRTLRPLELIYEPQPTERGVFDAVTGPLWSIFGGCDGWWHRLGMPALHDLPT